MKLEEYELKALRKLPEHIQPGIQRYVEEGRPVGDFLQAVISNDLKESFGRADDTNRERLYQIVCWFYSCAPAPCWGSPEAYQEWIEKHQRKERE